MITVFAQRYVQGNEITFAQNSIEVDKLIPRGFSCLEWWVVDQCLDAESSYFLQYTRSDIATAYNSSF